MTRHAARLEVLQLGERILPSVTVAIPPAQSGKVVFAPQSSLSSLSGSGQGSFNLAPTRFGQGPLYSLRGTGTIAGMGSVSVTGSLSAPALHATGPVTGMLVMKTSQGSVTVALTAPSQSGNSALPTSYQYHIVASSGVFFGSSATGTMHLSLTLGRSNVGLGSMSFSF
jgi:hypothetical protein